MTVEETATACVEMSNVAEVLAAETVTLKRLVRDLPNATGTSFGERLATMQLADVELRSWEDVDDPAGGDLPVFRACAREIRDLIDQLVPELQPQPIADEEIA